MQYTKAQIVVSNIGVVLLLSLFPACILTQTGNLNEENEPVVIGYGENLFKLGELLYADNFEAMDNWIPQVQSSNAETEYKIEFSNGYMDVLMPDRGASIWFRHKLSGPVTIVYDVTAPANNDHENNTVPRDINSFWHASDPMIPSNILNSSNDYTGAFSTYHKQHGYYASIGGRNNTTTRFRRYPRMTRGEPVKQIALSDKDNLEDYLIKPDSTHTIQLVAYKDVIQYIVDGKVFYEIKEGDQVTLELADGEEGQALYTSEQFPPYTEGWFGFRLVRSHHLYSNFRVYRLVPAK
ncbi:MAG: DUF6250 domain-containing protein [Balneolales bacterium]